MTISQALSSASSGLSAAARRAGVTSNNIANALTEGYSRREVLVSERVTDGEGAGVIVSGVRRAYNPAVTYERRLADSETAFGGATTGALTRVANLLGGPEEASSLFQKYANFESALRELAETPDSAPLQQKVVTTAKDIAGAFNKISTGYQQIRADADKEIGARVNEVNDALQQIEQLNNAIGKGSVTGTDVTALLDQRQQLINKVNESIPVRELQRDNGKVDLMTPEGVFLLAGSARKVEFNASPVMTDARVYNGGAGSLSGISVEGKDITPGGPGGQPLSGGAIAGLFNVRDTVLPEASLALDALAFDLANRFSDAGLDATLAPGAPGLFTDAGALGFFLDRLNGGAIADISTLSGLSSRLAVNAAVDTSQGGAAWRIRDGIGAVAPGASGSDILVRGLVDAMTATRPTNAALQASGDLNAAEAAAHLTSLAGGARAISAARLTASSALSQSLYEAEKFDTGVDTDRELQELLVIEQAYAANARVLETIDQMIRRLMEI